MNLLNWFFKRKTREESVETIFKIAEEGMFNMPIAMTPQGRLEVYMFDVWLGVQMLEKKKIHVSYELIFSKIESIKTQKLNLSKEIPCDMIYCERIEGWEHDIHGLVMSDYPRTKQFLPGYMYLCMIEKPLSIFADNNAISDYINNELDIANLADFLSPFSEHYIWIYTKITKLLKYI